MVVSWLENEIVEVFNRLPSGLLYHNLEHTRGVAASVGVLSRMEKLTEDSTELLIVAALLHDIGYLVGYEHNEQFAAQMAYDILARGGVKAEVIAHVQRLILATDMRLEPSSLEEKILRDADMAHLASENYAVIAENLRLEISSFRGPVSELDWHREQIQFLTHHQYYTQAARHLYADRKAENLAGLLRQI